MTSELLPAAKERELTPVILPPETYARIVELTPLVSIDLVVRDPAGRILLGYRRNRPAQGFWFVPGGRLGKNELRNEAFLRLSRAELGVDLEIGQARFLGVYEHLYSDNFSADPSFGTHYVVLAYEIEAEAGDLCLPKEDQHEGYLWLTESEIGRRADVHEYSKAYCASLHQ
jgi:colanic acid biosynthesis protein WcaH